MIYDRGGRRRERARGCVGKEYGMRTVSGRDIGVEHLIRRGGERVSPRTGPLSADMDGKWECVK